MIFPMVVAVLKDVFDEDFSVYAQDWLNTRRIVLGHKCSVVLLLVVTVQAEGAV